MGYTYLHFSINNQKFIHIFHLVPDNFPIPFEGLLGNDFLKSFNCLIDYQNNKLFVQDKYLNLYHLEYPLDLRDTLNDKAHYSNITNSSNQSFKLKLNNKISVGTENGNNRKN